MFDHSFDMLKLEYSNDRIFVKLKIKPGDKTYIYILTKFLEQLDA